MSRLHGDAVGTALCLWAAITVNTDYQHYKESTWKVNTSHLQTFARGSITVPDLRQDTPWQE